MRPGELRVPEVCCCCLNPRQWVKRHKILIHVENTGAGRVEEFVRVPFPWCRRCLLLRYGFFWASIVGFGVLTVVFGCFVAELMEGSTTSALPFLGAMAAAGVLTLLLRALVTAVLPVKPGHVPMCLAFDDHGGGMGSVVFQNRAFAELWRQLNGT